MAFIEDNDYTALVRVEIKNILTEENPTVKLKVAEQMAIDQVKNHLKGSYDVKAMFEQTGNQRNSYLVMIVLDCCLYHLYSSINARQINDIRSQRYADALSWLKAVAKGQMEADLPRLKKTDGTLDSRIKLDSRYKASNHRW